MGEGFAVVGDFEDGFGAEAVLELSFFGGGMGGGGEVEMVGLVGNGGGVIGLFCLGEVTVFVIKGGSSRNTRKRGVLGDVAFCVGTATLYEFSVY